MTTNLMLPTILDDFDILFRNLFDSESRYLPVKETSFGYPVDIIHRDRNLEFHIAALGLNKSDINISTEGNVLRVKYEKTIKDEVKDEQYIRRNITRKAFNQGWKVSSKFNLNNIQASLNNGLLVVKVPESEEQKPKQISIK